MSTQAHPTVLTRGIDLDLTPDQAFENLHRMPGFFFLDSGMADHELSRYSYIGVNPFLTVRSRGEGIDIIEGKTIRHAHGNPLQVLSQELNRRHLSGGSPLFPFAGGGVGYFSYELGRMTAEVPLAAPDDLGLPEMHVSFYKTVLAYDHRGRRWLGASVDLVGGRGATMRKKLGNEILKLAELASKQHRGTATVATAAVETDTEEGATTESFSAPPVPDRRFPVDGVEVTSTLSREEYMQAVRRIQERIASGDVLQASLAQRWSLPYDGEPGRLYMALRHTCPVPFGFYMNAGESILAGASPESFLSVNGHKVEMRPLRGSRPRGATPEEDERLRRELEESDRDNAELGMIAELQREELQTVCQPGSVEVVAPHHLETFARVHHLVAVIRGELQNGVSFRELMDAVFPSASVTGVPRRRAMALLDELEGTVRGPYSGAMGYLGLDGSISLNVAIRTLILSQGLCHLGVNTGVVSDSDPETEYEQAKAAALGLLAAWKEAREKSSVGS